MPPASFLPPKQVRLYDPQELGKIPTPVDERGIVDVDKLISLGIETVNPNYDWREPFTLSNRQAFHDIHHLHWPRVNYPVENGDQLPHEFRNLPINLVDVPRVFHNWLHLLTEKPAVPDREVMNYYTEAQRVVTSLFRVIKHSKKLTRIPNLDTETINQALVRQFDTFNTAVERHYLIPEPYQLVDLSSYQGESIDEMFNPRLVRDVGKYAIISTAVRRVERHQYDPTLESIMTPLSKEI